MFGEPRSYAVGTSPLGLVTGEFDGNPGVDLATANENNSVSVLVNEGNGVFGRGRPIEIPERYTVTGVTAGLYNGDAVADFAFSGIDTDDLAGVDLVYRSRQPGLYLAQAVMTALFPTCITDGDLSGDGLLDLATCGLTSDGAGLIGLARANANFTFSAAQGVQLGAAVPSRLVIGDVDQDITSRTDIISLSTAAGTAQVLYGRDGLTFDPPALLAELREPSAAVLATFATDTLPSIAVTTRLTGEVHVFRQVTPRQFTGPARYPVGELPVDMAAADFDRDGQTDLAVLNNLSNDVTILQGRADGTFEELESVRVGSGPVSLVVADLNGDGKLDIATANQDDQTFGPDAQSVTVVLNGVTPAFTPTPIPTATRTPRRSFTPTPTFTTTRTPTPAGPGDNNCDGVRDERDVQTVVARIFDGQSGCLNNAVTAADVPWTIQRIRS